MVATWTQDLKALVRKHKYDFDAAAREVGATAKELRVELAPGRYPNYAVPSRLRCLCAQRIGRACA